MTDIAQYLPWHPSHATDTRIRLADKRQSITGAAFAEQVDAVATQLLDNGVKRGDVVATFLSNRIELLTVICATWRIGAAVTPLNPTFTANESSYQVKDSSARLVVAEDDIAANDPEAHFPGAVVLPVSQLYTSIPEGTDLPAPSTAGDDIAFIIYTSGSTGRPKGVLLDHANVDAMSLDMNEVVGMTDDEHALMILPLFHSNALLAGFLAPFRGGGRITIEPRFDPATFVEAVQTAQPTYFSAVPAIYSYLLALPDDVDADFSSLRFAICGAAPASIEMLLAFEERFRVRVLTGYGLTEGTCVSTVMRPTDEPRSGSVGRPLPRQEVRIADENGGFAPAGVRGEVLIKGPNVMRGYLNRRDDTDASFRDGWLRTGDVGVIDDDGFLSIVDRIKHLIIRGGENLYPSEIEAALTSHGDIAEAAVVAAPHPVLNEIPIAYVTGAPDLDDLRAHISARLAKVKLPEAIHVLPDLPRNPVGKVDKIALAEMAAAAVAR